LEGGQPRQTGDPAKAGFSITLHAANRSSEMLAFGSRKGDLSFGEVGKSTTNSEMELIFRI
jgi:hypothetical protein